MADSIVGRRDELQALARLIAAVPLGGQALLLEGDAGIGKTALWRGGLSAARASGARVLAARAYHSETTAAFTTIGDLVGPFLDELVRLVPVQRRALEVALLLRESEGAPPETRVLGAGLLTLVRSLAEETPVLIALDDVQWIDASSEQVIGFMLRRVGESAVGVLATVRGSPADTPLDLDRSFPGCERMRVGPLSVGAIHRILWDRLGLNLPRPTLVRVHEAAGGNPFYALELGRHLARTSATRGAARVSLPASLRNVVSERLRALPPGVAETLAAVAAVAAPTMTLLGPLGGSTVSDLEHALDEEVLELDGERIRFTHPLLAPACYSAVPLSKRRRLHRRLAGLDVDLEERARHLAVAADGPDEAVASALDVGAAHAQRRGAAVAAAELAELAVELTPAAAAGDLTRRRVAAAEHVMAAGDPRRADDLLTSAVESADTGSARATALSRLASVRNESEGFPAAEPLFVRALAEPQLDVAERVDIHRALAWIAASGGASPDGLRHAETALQLAEELGRPDLLASSLARFAEVTFWQTGRIRHDLLDRALELGHDAGAPEVRLTRARLLGRADRFEEARPLWDELISEGRAREDPDLILPLMFAARMEVASGEWLAAREHCREAIALARLTGREMGETLCRMVLAEIDAYRGEVEVARREIPEFLRVASGIGYQGAIHRLSRALAVLELSCRDPAASWRLVAPLLADVAELDEVLGQLAGSVGIEALIDIGDLAEAERLLRLLDDLAAGADTALRPLADRCRGTLLSARGDDTGAVRVLEAASASPDPPQGANPLELARAVLALGTVERRAQHKRRARDTLERAAEGFEQLGARTWAEEAHAQLRRIGGRTASASRLSETERLIVELVVAGRKNREVAEALSLSPNTVAWNLSKIYRKLGVASRTELAARLAPAAKE